MLDKIKDLGVQAVVKAGDAVNSITASVKEGVGSLADGAGSVTESLNERAVRASTAQMCSILEIALKELESRPLSNRRISLTATVNIGVASLEMQIHREPTVMAAVPETVTLP
jgi:hypothetical protein